MKQSIMKQSILIAIREMIMQAFEYWHSQGSVTKRLRCGGILNDHFVANLLSSVQVKKFYEIVKCGGLLFMDYIDPGTEYMQGSVNPCPKAQWSHEAVECRTVTYG